MMKWMNEWKTCWLSWYGSCPMITTFTFSHGQCTNALNTSLRGGKIVSPLFSSDARNFYPLTTYRNSTNRSLKYVFFDSFSINSPQYPLNPEWNSLCQLILAYSMILLHKEYRNNFLFLLNILYKWRITLFIKTIIRG